ncbi:putative phage abortive infection protein [Fibrobacter sp.]|uniref:putative phage abortive infection protein n=1 Tax=Fibrobacter sp. TaxID=35828 RepID=UPI003868BC67
MYKIDNIFKFYPIVEKNWVPFFILALGGLFIFLLICCFRKGHFWDNVKKYWSNALTFYLGLCALAFAIFSFVAPNFFTGSWYTWDSSSSANIGNTVNGLMSPFIAIAAAILTFMAFWVQYNANQRIVNENKKQQIERQFYEMLKIHNDNVRAFGAKTRIPIGFSLSNPAQTQWIELMEYGQSYLQVVLIEFNYIFEMIKSNYSDKRDQWFIISYNIFFFGAEYTYNLGQINKELLEELQSCRNAIWRDSYDYSKLTVLGDSVFRGHLAQFNSYYRHLFLIVKTVVHIDEKILDYQEKRQFLRILRAQLTSVEQVLLFYNWKSGCGGKWEESKNDGSENHFFTDYRMIHNINPDDCKAFSKEELLNEILSKNKEFKYEGTSRKNDPLFELIG